jgi:hypothetical protein
MFCYIADRTIALQWPKHSALLALILSLQQFVDSTAPSGAAGDM